MAYFPDWFSLIDIGLQKAAVYHQACDLLNQKLIVPTTGKQAPNLLYFN